jgi:ABC-type sugar transport system ATPase subunit
LIRLQNISWKAGAFALENVSFDVPAASYAVLMGRTGTGKTSLVEIICGIPPGQRGLGFVPQDGALFPTMTVADQIGFALRIQKAPPNTINATVQELASEMAITHLLDRKPTGLSGGEKQRVALARALAAKPTVLLLDEPLAAVDEDTQTDLIQLLKRTQRQHQITVLHVTHSRREAEALATLRLRLENHAVHIDSH